MHVDAPPHERFVLHHAEGRQVKKSACLPTQVIGESEVDFLKAQILEDMVAGRLPCMPVCSEIEFLQTYMGPKALAGKEIIPEEGEEAR